MNEKCLKIQGLEGTFNINEYKNRGFIKGKGIEISYKRVTYAKEQPSENKLTSVMSTLMILEKISSSKSLEDLAKEFVKDKLSQNKDISKVMEINENIQDAKDKAQMVSQTIRRKRF